MKPVNVRPARETRPSARGASRTQTKTSPKASSLPKAPAANQEPPPQARVQATPKHQREADRLWFTSAPSPRIPFAANYGAMAVVNYAFNNRLDEKLPGPPKNAFAKGHSAAIQLSSNQWLFNVDGRLYLMMMKSDRGRTGDGFRGGAYERYEVWFDLGLRPPKGQLEPSPEPK